MSGFFSNMIQNIKDKKEAIQSKMEVLAVNEVIKDQTLQISVVVIIGLVVRIYLSVFNWIDVMIFCVTGIIFRAEAKKLFYKLMDKIKLFIIEKEINKSEPETPDQDKNDEDIGHEI